METATETTETTELGRETPGRVSLTNRLIGATFILYGAVSLVVANRFIVGGIGYCTGELPRDRGELSTDG